MKNHYIISQNIIANKGLRLGNYLIDVVVILLSIFALSTVFLLVADVIGYDAGPIMTYIDKMNKLEEHLFGQLFTIPYYIFMEVMTGRTIGKYLTGTIVVDHEGNKPNLETIIKRSFSRAIPFNGLSFLGEKSRGWHDSISETYVVITKELEKEKQNYLDFNEIGKKESQFENDFNV